MKITNFKGLPEPVFFWVTKYNQHNEEERKKSIDECQKKTGKNFDLKVSCTQLIKPLQELVLTDRYYDKMEREAVTLMPAILGTAIHQSFELMPLRDQEMREVRVAAEIKGVLVSAQIDNIYKKEISDYKTMAIGSYLYGDKEYEFTTQLSIGRYLLAEDLLLETSPVGKVILIFSDWRDDEYKKKKYKGFINAPNYPFRSVELTYDLWDHEKTKNWLMRKVTNYKIASMQEDHMLPECSDKERWMKENKKTGEKTYRKCLENCSAAPFCSQNKGVI